VPLCAALGKGAINGVGTVTVAFLCRVPSWRSAKPLSRAREIALGKETSADENVPEGPLPSAALGKGFAEGK
jgi:hypothetical protein